MAAAIALVACGGGEGSTKAPGPQLATAAPAVDSPVAVTPYVIDYYGDSTVWGQDPAGTGVQLPGNPPVVLQTELTSRCGFPVKVRNFGVPSSRLGEAIEGNNAYYGQSFADAMSVSPANMVIVNHGINDARLQTLLGAYSVNMRAMGRIATAHGKRFVIETANPVVGPGEAWVGENAYLGQMVAAATSIALVDEYPLVDQYAYFMSLGNLLAYFPDGAHPSTTTATMKALRVADVVKPLVCP